MYSTFVFIGPGGVAEQARNGGLHLVRGIGIGTPSLLDNPSGKFLRAYRQILCDIVEDLRPIMRRARSPTTGGMSGFNSVTNIFTVALTNLANNANYSCTWKDAGAARESLSGTCIDRTQNAWKFSLSRAPGHALARSYNIPRVDLSNLNTAEKAAFSELLARQQCGCGMHLLVCLRKHPACTYSSGLTQTTLAAFLKKVRS